MSNEFTIDQDIAGFDDAQEMRRLVNALSLARKYYLFFACCNQVPRQNELIAQIQAKLPGKHIEIVRFPEPITDLLDELKTIIAGKKPDAVFVQGLENSISSEGGGNNFIYALNLSRDSFNDALPCPMVLWLPEYAIVKINRHAPDFFSVRSGVFYFSQTSEAVIGQIFQSTSSAPLEILSLPIAEKRQRIAMLESLLAEYQGLHAEKRDKQAELRLKLQLALIFDSIAEYRKAIDCNSQALCLAQELGEREREGRAVGNLGNAYAALGETRRAVEFYEQALTIAREIGDRRGEGNALGNLGNAYKNLGKTHRAIEFHEQALAVMHEIGDRRGEGSTLGNLGNAYAALGETPRAIEFYEQALAVDREIGDRRGEGNSLGNLGNAYKNLGETRRAIEFYEQALTIAREIGDRHGEGNALGNLGLAYCNGLGDKARSVPLAEAALRIFETIEDPNAARVRGWLARLKTQV